LKKKARTSDDVEEGKIDRMEMYDWSRRWKDGSGEGRNRRGRSWKTWVNKRKRNTTQNTRHFNTPHHTTPHHTTPHHTTPHHTTPHHTTPQ
jgi:hypothetical protein